MEPEAAAVTSAGGMSQAIPFLGAGLDLASGIVTSAFNIHEQRQNRRTMVDLANTSHQREVADLKKAGLNPILSASRGAPTPPVSGAQMTDIAPGSKLNQAMNNRLMMLQTSADLATKTAQARDTTAAAQLKELDLRVGQQTEEQRIMSQLATYRQLYTSFDMQSKQRDFVEQQIVNLQQQLKNLQLENQHSAYGLSKDKAESDMYKNGIGKDLPWLKPILDILHLIK